MEVFHNISDAEIFVPTPLVTGRKYRLKWVFFVQTILADRYIHHGEMPVISLKSSSKVEFETKKKNFVFFEALSWFKILSEHVIFV